MRLSFCQENPDDWLAAWFPLCSQIPLVPRERLVALWPSRRNMNDHILLPSSWDVLQLF